MKKLLIFAIFYCFVPIMKGQIPFPIVWGISQTLDFSDTNSTKYIMIDSLISTNIFQIGSPQKPIINSAYSTPNAIVTDTISFYPDNNRSIFYMTLLKNEGLLDFYFRTQYDTDIGVDGGNIEISFDGGATWGNVIDSTFLSIYNIQIGYGTNFYTKYDTVQSLSGEPGFSGNSNGWIHSSFGLFYQNAVQNTDTFLLKFEFASDSLNTNKEGWAIDDIVIHANHVGISEVTKTDFIVFPNPSKGQFTIGHFTQGDTEISIYNTLGLRLKDLELNSGEIVDLSKIGRAHV